MRQFHHRSLVSRQQSKTSLELYVFLGDLCNFSCAHCCCNSGPKADKYRISDEEIDRLAEFVNSHEEVLWVHFTGGEPSLFIGPIKRLQSRITRNIQYAMTSNGWFAGRLAKILDGVSLHHIHFSYDKFHDKFITKEKMEKAVQAAKELKIEVTINSVFQEITDLSYAKNLGDNLKISGRQLTQGGRQKEVEKTPLTLRDNNPAERKCYSFEPGEKSEERAIYIPGKGLTPCCGPLVFEELAEDSLLYSSLDHGLEVNRLYQSLKGKTFAELGQKSTQCAASRCDLCVKVHGRKGLESGRVLNG